MTTERDQESILTPDLLISAYANGYFPMPHPETEEICWFHPDPRAVIPLDGFALSHSLRKTMRKVPFVLTIDQDFEGVLEGCADREETWINAEMKAAYVNLHKLGHAHSIEIWLDGRLVGGTYGLAIRGAFFAESMFHRETDASKVALFCLVEHLKASGMKLLEVQFLTPHLKSLGALEISAEEYMAKLAEAIKAPVTFLRQV